MRRFGVRADGEDASARAWVVAWTPASAKSASARTPTSLRGVSHVHVRTFRKRATQGDASVRRVGFAGRAFGCGEDACVLESLDLRASRGVNPGTQRRRARGGVFESARHRCVVASFLEDGTHPPRTAFAVETRRVARLFAASMSMPSKPSVAFSYAGPPSRIIVAPKHARACFSADLPLNGSTHSRNFAAAPAGDPGSVSLLPRQTLAAAARFVTPTRAACPRNAARREHEPRDARPKPGRRGDRRAPARRRASRVRRGGAPGGWPRLQSLRRVGSPRHAVRGVRVRGGQDRQRAGRHPRRFAGRARARRGAPARLRAPARTRAFSVSRHTPSADTRTRRPAFSSSRGSARAFRAFGKPRSCSTRLSRSPARLALQPHAIDAFQPSFSVRLLCDRSPPRRRRRRNASPAR